MISHKSDTNEAKHTASSITYESIHLVLSKIGSLLSSLRNRMYPLTVDFNENVHTGTNPVPDEKIEELRGAIDQLYDNSSSLADFYRVCALCTEILEKGRQKKNSFRPRRLDFYQYLGEQDNSQKHVLKNVRIARYERPGIQNTRVGFRSGNTLDEILIRARRGIYEILADSHYNPHFVQFFKDGQATQTHYYQK